MNRAYDLQPEAGPPAWFLLEAEEGACERGIVDYARHVDFKPQIVTKHPELGVVYRATWPSLVSTPHGNLTARTLFLICDGDHRWHFIGEGPEEGEGKQSMDEHYVTRVESRGEWVADRAAPLNIRCTRIILWFTPSEIENDPRFPDLELRQDFILGGKLPAQARGWMGQSTSSSTRKRRWTHLRSASRSGVRSSDGKKSCGEKTDCCTGLYGKSALP